MWHERAEQWETGQELLAALERPSVVVDGGAG